MRVITLRNLRHYQAGQFFYLLCFLMIPFLIHFFFRLSAGVFNSGKLPSQNEWFQSRFVYFLILQYFLILTGFFTLQLVKPREIRFFAWDNWFVTLGRSLMPSMITFITGYFITMILILITFYIPLNDTVRNWIRTPNEGFIRVMEAFKNRNSLQVFFWIFSVTVLAPFSEEILFRGFLQEFLQYFKRLRHYRLDIVLTAMVFSLFHIESLSNAVYALVIGIFLSWYRRISGRINMTIWIHGLINLTGLISGILFSRQ